MGKSSGKAKTPKIAADNLESKQIISIVDIIGEGKIHGIVNGLQGVFLDGVPIQNPDGSYNFNGVEIAYTLGTQAQEPLKGFESVQNEVSVGLEVKQKAPIVRAITDPYIDRVRVTVGVRELLSQNKKGDIKRTSVSMEIQIGRDGRWTTKHKFDLIDKKTRSGYLRSFILDDLPEKPFNIRVVRITPDSKDDLLSNSTIWSSYTEIYDTKLSYPNTALVGLKFDSSQFSSIPARTYLIDGLEFLIPDNYDPRTRTYNGVWKGNFKTDWTNNPAWIIYGILTNDRFGMGKKFKNFKPDKFMMYSIGQRCDELVDDGFGGKEPRFTCNCAITEQSQAYDLINNFFSIFRAMPVWNGTQMTAVVDRPRDPVTIYTNANVVNGRFSYSSSAKNDRHTAARVKYTDPSHNWDAVTEYVPDDQLIARFGFNPIDVEAFGCTSRGQTHRLGKWIIQTEKLETKTVSFSVGIAGIRHLPGDIIGILDNNYVGAQAGGRIKEINGRTITLDRDVEIGDNAHITYQNVDAKQVKVKVISQDAPNVLTLAEPVNAEKWAVWILTNSLISMRLCRALTIAENDDGTYSITAVDHDPNKEKIVDSSASFIEDSTSLTTYGQAAPKNIKILPFYEVRQGITVAILTAEWERAEGAAHYEAQWRKDNSTWVNVPKTPNVSITIEGIYSGVYDVRVRSIGATGQSSPWAYSESTEIKGKVGKPDQPVGFTASDNVAFGINLSWGFPAGSGDTSHTEIQYSTNENEENALPLTNAVYPSCSYSQTGLAVGQVFFYRARLVDRIGNVSDWTNWIRGSSTTDTNELSNHFFDEIKETDAWNSLVGQVDKNTETVGNHATSISSINTSVSNQNNTITAQAEKIESLSTSINGVSTAITDVSKAIQDTNGKLSAYRTMKVEVDKNGKQYIAGMTMGVEQTSSGTQSNVIFLADKFMVMNKPGATPIPAFTVNNGNVIMNNAFIGNGTITNAKIGNVIQSDNYQYGVSGWQLIKNPGKLNAVDVDISGKIKATAGEMNNVVINENCQIKGTLRVEQIVGTSTQVYTCLTNNGTITITPESFERQILFMPITVYSRKTPAGGDHAPDTWESTTISIAFDNVVKHKLTTDIASETKSFIEQLPANKSVVINVKSGSTFHKEKYLPEFITMLVIKK